MKNEKKFIKKQPKEKAPKKENREQKLTQSNLNSISGGSAWEIFKR